MKSLGWIQNLLAAFLVLLLAACSEKELILPGERQSVLPQLAVVTIDNGATEQGAELGNAVINNSFTHAGGNAGHSGGHLSLNQPLTISWQAKIAGVPDETVDLAQPVISDDAVYALGSDGVLHAFALADGALLWTSQLEELIDEPLPGVAGGIAAGTDNVFAHASQYGLVALSSKTGDVLWSVSHPERLKGGPTLIGDEGVLVSDINGQLYLYDAASGARLWERIGLPTNTVVFGAPAPAFGENEVILAGAAGELSSYDPLSGDLLWADNLASFNPRTPLQELGDVRAHPVHDGKLVYVISQSGRMVAFQAGTGFAIWEQPITSIELPWIAGRSVFVTGLDGRLYALRRNDGAARWITELPGALPIGAVASEEVPRYSAPFVASGKVYVISNAGILFSFDANTGLMEGEMAIGGPVTTAPAVAQEALIVVKSQGQLSVFR